MQNFNWQRTDLIDESEEVVLHQTKEQKIHLKSRVVFKLKIRVQVG